MSRPTPARAVALAALLASATALAACGKTGELKRPAPLFGHARSTTRPADDQARQAQDPSRPVTTVDPRDNTLENAPARTEPIQGQSPDPIGTHPPGALPDPFSNPQ